MTQNQSNAIVKNPSAKKAVMILQKFAELDTQHKAMKKEAEEARALITAAMVEAGVPKIEDLKLPGFTGFITLAERVNYKADDLEAVDEKFLKPALDTDKVKAERTLTGELPAGIVESKTNYIIPKFKVVK